MLLPHSIAGMPPRPRDDSGSGTEAACAGSVSTCDEWVRSTDIRILLGVFSSNAMPLPTSAGRYACLRRVPFPGARSESGAHAWPSRALQARTRAYTGRAHLVSRLRKRPKEGCRPVGGATTAWPGRRPRRENSPPATDAMPSRASESTNVKAKYRFWYEVEARD